MSFNLLIMEILEIVELHYYYIILKTRNKVQSRLRYTIPLIVPMIPTDPFEFQISGVVCDVNWDEKREICQFKLIKLEFEELIKLDSREIYKEVVDWWVEKHSSNPKEIFIDSNYILSPKYVKYKELKEKIDLVRLFSGKMYNKRRI